MAYTGLNGTFSEWAGEAYGRCGREMALPRLAAAYPRLLETSLPGLLCGRLIEVGDACQIDRHAPGGFLLEVAYHTFDGSE